MSRTARKQSTTGIYHVMIRGINRQNIFEDLEDYMKVIKTLASLGEVTVGLFTDEAIKSYKSPPYMDYTARKTVIENIKGVSHVIPQISRDYEWTYRTSTARPIQE